MSQENDRKPKDPWERISSLINLVIILAGSFSGSYASNLYKDRELTINEVKTIESFMPYITGEKGGDDRNKTQQNVILVISSLQNPGIAINLATFNPGLGSILALKNIALFSPDKTDRLRAVEAIRLIGGDNNYAFAARNTLLSITQQTQVPDSQDIIQRAQESLEILTASPIPGSTSTSQASSTSAPKQSWTIQGACDTSFESTYYELDRAKANGIDQPIKIYKRGTWYIAGIGEFATQQEAQNYLSTVKQSMNQAAFLVNLDTFCPTSGQKQNEAGYVECPTVN